MTFDFDLKKKLEEEILIFFKEKSRKYEQTKIKGVDFDKIGYKGFILILDKQKHVYIYSKIIVFLNRNIYKIYIDEEYYFEEKLLTEMMKKYKKKIRPEIQIELDLEILKVKYHKTNS